MNVLYIVAVFSSHQNVVTRVAITLAKHEATALNAESKALEAIKMTVPGEFEVLNVLRIWTTPEDVCRTLHVG